MPPSTLELFNTVVVTGGGGGVGKAMAEFLISRKKRVIIVGRTESNLQATAKEIGATSYYVLDTGDVGSVRS
jgi:short-subunit dehydrogenase involved in D-alanine esterification of teichoic acids